MDNLELWIIMVVGMIVAVGLGYLVLQWFEKTPSKKEIRKLVREVEKAKIQVGDY